MVNCKNCGRKVLGDGLLCCHCGYPLMVARLIPWSRKLWSMAPQQFWKVTILLSLLVAIATMTGIVVHIRRGLPFLYLIYLFALSLVIFFWADLGSRKNLR